MLYDIITVPSYSSSNILEYWHAPNHPDLEQINMGMVMGRSRNIPLVFEIILDRGFFSYENLSLLGDDSHIIAASFV